MKQFTLKSLMLLLLLLIGGVVMLGERLRPINMYLMSSQVPVTR